MGYRVIIADDEPKIIRLIRMLGHWEEYGIEIVAEYHDSENALNGIISLKPDFVISDIKMPGMDGLQMIEEARKAGSETLFILISGYRHFEYARSAIALNVVDYLLKPVSEEQLNLTLEKVCMQIKAQQESRESRQEFMEMKARQEGVSQAEFWSYMTYPWKDEDYRKYFTSEKICNEHFQFSFTEGMYIIVIISSDVAGGMENQVSLFSSEIERLIQKFLCSHSVCYYHMVHVGYNVVMNFKKEDYEQIKEGISALYYSIRDLQEIYGNFSLSIGVSETKTRCIELKEAFLEARAAEWGKLVMMQNGVLWHSQVAGFPKVNVNFIISEEEIGKVKSCIKYLRQEELGEAMKGIAERTASYGNAYPGCVNEAFYRLVDGMDEVIREDRRDSVHMRFDMAFNGAKSYMNLMRNLYAEINAYIEEEKKKLDTKSGKPITEVLHYIHMNYSKPISQEDAALAGNVSTSYLSKLFKEEMGIGFQEYLTQVRLEEAEKMLSSTNQSIKDIATAVGYPDEKYFSKLYKKMTGIKPSEYRKIYG